MYVYYIYNIVIDIHEFQVIFIIIFLYFIPKKIIGTLFYSKNYWTVILFQKLLERYFIPKLFGTLPFVNGDGEFILAVCVVGEPTVIIVPFIDAFLT